MVHEEECESAGIDPAVLQRLANRLERLLKDMERAGLDLFCGSTSSIRPYNGDRKLILYTLDQCNVDGSCGAYSYGNDGLRRGEDA